MSTNDQAIATLLARARAKHAQYRQHLPDGSSPDALAAREALHDAYDLRLEAEALDPNLTSPVFRNEPEKFQHTAVMAFYRDQLGL